MINLLTLREQQDRRLKSSIVSAWTWDLFSWFHSVTLFTKQHFSNWSLYTVGTAKHLRMLAADQSSE